MQTIEKKSLATDLSDIKFAKMILKLVTIKNLHIDAKNPADYAASLENFLDLLEKFSQENSYNDFCDLRDAMLDNLGLAIHHLQVSMKQKDLSHGQKRNNKELLKVASRIFTQIVDLRD